MTNREHFDAKAQEWDEHPVIYAGTSDIQRNLIFDLMD